MRSFSLLKNTFDEARVTTNLNKGCEIFMDNTGLEIKDIYKFCCKIPIEFEIGLNQLSKQTPLPIWPTFKFKWNSILIF